MRAAVSLLRESNNDSGFRFLNYYGRLTKL